MLHVYFHLVKVKAMTAGFAMASKNAMNVEQFIAICLITLLWNGKDF
jgi:hypothetical protein